MRRHLINLVLAPLPPTRFLTLRRALLGFAGLNLARGARVCGRGWIYGRGELAIGQDSWVSPGTVFYTHLEAPISVGRDCDIGPYVLVLTGSHEMGSHNRRAGRGTAEPVSIGDGCWVGARTVILGGVTIGPGSIIAAGSVVTRDVPANSLAAGVPAEVRRQLD